MRRKRAFSDMIRPIPLSLPILLFAGAYAHADTIVGRVIDPQGTGVAGVNIGADDLINGGDGGIANGGTDAGGFFTVTIDPGLYDLLFEPASPPLGSLLTLSLSEQFVAGTLNLGDLTLAQGVVLSGTVLGPNLLPVENVNLDIIDRTTGANMTLPNDSSNQSGQFMVAVPIGPIELRLDPTSLPIPLLAPFNQSLTLTSATDLGDIILEPGWNVTAVVMDAAFSGVDNADIDVVNIATGNKLYTPGDNSDNNGFVDFVLPSGLFEIEFCPQFSSGLVGDVMDNVAISADTNLGITNLQAGVVLSGHVRTQPGLDVARADIDLRDVATGLGVTTCGDNTDSNGDYAVNVPNGLFTVTVTPVYADKLASRTYNNVTVSGDTVRNAVLFDCDCGSSSGAGRPGSGGLVPQITALGSSLRLGNPAWGFEVSSGLGGAPGMAFLTMGGQCGSGAGGGLYRPTIRLSAPAAFTLDGTMGSAGAGNAQLLFELPDAIRFLGATITARAIVFDAGAASGIARTPKLCGDLCQ
ncbi:MAG: hypothetical protein ACI841_001585 [Planctomycetota bacterium]